MKQVSNDGTNWTTAEPGADLSVFRYVRDAPEPVRGISSDPELDEAYAEAAGRTLLRLPVGSPRMVSEVRTVFWILDLDGTMRAVSPNDLLKDFVAALDMLAFIAPAATLLTAYLDKPERELIRSKCDDASALLEKHGRLR